MKFKMLRNNRGCWGGGGKRPAPVAPVTPAPTPQAIAPSEVEGQVSEDERRKKLTRMRNGLASTIKTSAKGLTGSGSDLLTQTISGKDKLGA